MALKEKTLEAFNVIKDNGGRITTDELAETLGVAKNSVTGRVNSLVKNGFAVREKDESGEKAITFVRLTDEGMAYDPSADEDAE